MRYNNGDVYDGYWDETEKNGQGIMRYNNGTIYEGSWEDGKPNGEGTMRHSKTNIKRGTWEQGRRLRNPDDYDFYREDIIPEGIPPEINDYDKHGGSEKNKRKTHKRKTTKHNTSRKQNKKK